MKAPLREGVVVVAGGGYLKKCKRMAPEYFCSAVVHAQVRHGASLADLIAEEL